MPPAADSFAVLDLAEAQLLLPAMWYLSQCDSFSLCEIEVAAVLIFLLWQWMLVLFAMMLGVLGVIVATVLMSSLTLSMSPVDVLASRSL